MAETYPSNSNKAKESSLIREPIEMAPTPKQLEDTHPRIDVSEPRQRKISPVREVFRAIFPGGFAELKQHMVWDIFVPWMQDVLHSGWQGLGDVIFPGSDRSKQRGNPERYSYDKQYRSSSAIAYPSYDNGYYNDMQPMPTREAAEDALRDLEQIWLRYRVVTLLDFNERVGKEGVPTQANYGWLSLDGARIERAYGGWVISMPKAVPIDHLRR